MPAVRANITGIDELQKKLRATDPIYAQPWNDGLTMLTDTAVDRLRKAAPHGQGTLNAHFVTQMDARPVHEWALVSNKATNAGVAYPFLLNASERYHFDGGRATTKGWWTKTWAGMRKVVDETLNRVAREIEAKWQS